MGWSALANYHLSKLMAPAEAAYLGGDVVLVLVPAIK